MEEEALTPIRLVEAALFTAGRPISVDEIVQATGLDAKSVKRGLKALEMEYEARGDQTALEVGQAGEKWAMQLRTIYVQHARMLAEMEIPKKLLKTLALVAFHQPLLQSELVDMIGSKTYEHIAELTELGLVRARQEGQSKRLTTSTQFPEYFGIPTADTHEIRTFLAKKVGLTLKTRKGEAQLDAFGGSPAAAPNRLAPYALTPPRPEAIVEGSIRTRAQEAPVEETGDAEPEQESEAGASVEETVDAEAEQESEQVEPEAAAVTLDATGAASIE